MKATFVLILLLLGLEAGVRIWRYRGIESSRDPVFSWKDAQLVTRAPPPFGTALEMYRADRGMESFQDLPGGRSMQTVYLEWDDLETGPFSDVAGHEGEICNRAAGFGVRETRVPRTFRGPDGRELLFHYTHLVDPQGRTVHNYKMPWIQGIGAWHNGSAHDRNIRLRRSFIRHRGAVRVVQVGIFGEPDEHAAWALVQKQLSERLIWSQPAATLAPVQ